MFFKIKISKRILYFSLLGSGGWSDIGDFEIDAPEEKKEVRSEQAAVTRDAKESSADSSVGHNILEVARLRGQLERAK